MGEPDKPSEKPEQPLLLDATSKYEPQPNAATAVTDPSPASINPPPISLAPRLPKAIRKPLRQQDIGKFSLFVGWILAALIPILQMNMIEVNWQYSAIAYVILLTGLLWTFLAHGVPHCGKVIKVCGSLGIIASIGWLTVFATIKQYHKQHSKSPFDDLNERYVAQSAVLAQFTNLATELQGLKDIIATNPVIPASWRDRAIDMERRLVILNVESNELSAWRANNRKALWNGLRQVEKQRDDNRAEIETQYKKRLPILDYALDGLSVAMEKVAKLKGDKTLQNYYGLPLSLNTETNLPVEDIGFITNNNWTFHVTLKMDKYGTSWFRAACNGDALEIAGLDGSKYIYVGIGGKDLYYLPFGDDYTNAVDEAIGSLVEGKMEQEEKRAK